MGDETGVLALVLGVDGVSGVYTQVGNAGKSTEGSNSHKIALVFVSCAANIPDVNSRMIIFLEEKWQTGETEFDIIT